MQAPTSQYEECLQLPQPCILVQVVTATLGDLQVGVQVPEVAVHIFENNQRHQHDIWPAFTTS